MPFGLYQFKTMLFGLYGTAVTFQRLMDKVLQLYNQYAAAYINDIVIYSNSWKAHLKHVLQAFRSAGLTANPVKCHLANGEMMNLGYRVARGHLSLLIGKVQALAECLE